MTGCIPKYCPHPSHESQCGEYSVWAPQRFSCLTDERSTLSTAIFLEKLWENLTFGCNTHKKPGNPEGNNNANISAVSALVFSQAFIQDVALLTYTPATLSHLLHMSPLRCTFCNTVTLLVLHQTSALSQELFLLVLPFSATSLINWKYSLLCSKIDWRLIPQHRGGSRKPE